MAATQPRRCRPKNITNKELPLDVLFDDILPRVPARYAKKFLSVSKQWYSFLKSPTFANMHLNYHATKDDHHHKLLVLYEKVTTLNYWAEEMTLSYSNRDCETQEPGMRRRSLPFEYGFEGVIKITSSCNGLVLVVVRNDRNGTLSDLVIWNPLTTDYKTLPKTDRKILYYDTTFELYYNSCELDYRVLLVTVYNQAYIYSLKSDSWRKINFQYIPNSIPLGLSPSTCPNEKLYFKRYRVFDSITMFDTKTEKFTAISTPFQGDKCSGVTVQRDRIYMCQRKFGSIKLWSMERIGVWEEASTYKDRQEEDSYLLEPLHLTRDGNWLMKPDDKNRKYYSKVDLENKHKEGKSCVYKHEASVARVYIETFVSPNQYTN